jgi:hypothetical protein
LTAWRVRCERCELVYVARDETEARSLEATHQRDHERTNINAKIKVYELPWWRGIATSPTQAGAFGSEQIGFRTGTAN